MHKHKQVQAGRNVRTALISCLPHTYVAKGEKRACSFMAACAADEACPRTSRESFWSVVNMLRTVIHEHSCTLRRLRKGEVVKSAIVPAGTSGAVWRCFTACWRTRRTAESYHGLPYHRHDSTCWERGTSPSLSTFDPFSNILTESATLDHFGASL